MVCKCSHACDRGQCLEVCSVLPLWDQTQVVKLVERPLIPLSLIFLSSFNVALAVVELMIPTFPML